MKKHGYLILLVFILMLVGCGMLNGSPDYTGQRTDLYRLGLYNIPLGEKFNKIDEESIETDAYGRTMFYLIISPNNEFYPYSADQETVAAFILQKSDKESIWFYEDDCYIFGTNSNWKNPVYIFDQEKLEELKTRNDWNQPFNSEKCSSRPYYPNGNDYDGMEISFSNVEIAEGIRRYTQKKEDKHTGIINISPVNCDKNGKVLCAVSFRENKTSQIEHFFVISDPEGGGITEKNILAVDSLDFNKELHELKVKNDWAFE
jgi:hypothetical protein